VADDNHPNSGATEKADLIERGRAAAAEFLQRWNGDHS
jgi:hypothetical protein